MIRKAVNYLGDPKNIRRHRITLWIILALVFIADLLVPRAHVEHLWDKIPGWSAFYGLVSCVLIIVVSKFLGYAWLMKKEDYYD
ncbi:MAG TPA: hypothetical protein VJ187_03740 [Nitrospirota bacterium]|jgi:hypothetical protein|nr:hypothetical protein [Nitrospirota bacterium]